MTRWIIPCAVVAITALAAAVAADAPNAPSSERLATPSAADTCRPQPLCRAYVDGVQLFPAPPPIQGVELRGMYSTTEDSTEDQKQSSDDRRHMPASQSPSSGTQQKP